jgi:hypothetical protein
MSMEHIKPSLLFVTAEGRAKLDLTAQEHLMNCKNCFGALTVFKTYLVADDPDEAQPSGQRKKGRTAQS